MIDRSTDEDLAGVAVAAFEAAGRAPTPEQAEALGVYLDLLLRWSGRMNLTGFRSAEAAAEGLLVDALFVEPLLPDRALVLDVGAGAGGLAVALAVLRPDLALRLVEPRAKRAAFLRALRRALGLVAFEVVEARAQSLEPASVDGAYARAVLPPGEWLQLGRRLVRPGGVVLSLSARPLAAAEVPGGLVVAGERRYELPRSKAPRVVTALVRAPAR